MMATIAARGAKAPGGAGEIPVTSRLQTVRPKVYSRAEGCLEFSNSQRFSP